MGEFPISQLAALLARQISVPVATKFKEYARTHPWFSRHVCMATGRRFHSAQLRFKLWTLALRQPKHTPRITDEAALEQGADILGEAVIFLLGALIITSEFNRQAKKANIKVLEIKSQWMSVMLQLEELQRELAMQQQDLDRLCAELRRVAPHMFPPAPAPALAPAPAPALAPAPPSPPPLQRPTPDPPILSTSPSDTKLKSVVAVTDIIPIPRNN